MLDSILILVHILLHSENLCRYAVEMKEWKNSRATYTWKNVFFVEILYLQHTQILFWIALNIFNSI